MEQLYEGGTHMGNKYYQLELAGYEALIRKGEDVRERGNPDKAIEIFNELLSNSPLSIQASALGHIIVCYKHLYQKTDDLDYVSNYMMPLCQRGLEMEISEAEKSVFKLRQGDCYLALSKPNEAVELYKEALSMLPSGSPQKGEYRSHLAFGLAMAGRLSDAYNQLDVAEYQIDTAEGLKPFHRRVIVAGLRYKQAKIQKMNGDYFLAFTAGLQGLYQALVLAIWYWYPVRLKQFFQFCFGKSI